MIKLVPGDKISIEGTDIVKLPYFCRGELIFEVNYQDIELTQIKELKGKKMIYGTFKIEEAAYNIYNKKLELTLKKVE